MMTSLGSSRGGRHCGCGVANAELQATPLETARQWQGWGAFEIVASTFEVSGSWHHHLNTNPKPLRPQ